jgi:hypothetical protein
LTTLWLLWPPLHAYYITYWGAPPHEVWRRHNKKEIIYEAGNQNLTCYLELGHLTTSEKTTPFAQFILVSHEVRCETGVKDILLTIYPLSLGPGPLYQMICISFP